MPITKRRGGSLSKNGGIAKLPSLEDIDEGEDPTNFNEERAAQYIGVDTATLRAWREARLGPVYSIWFGVVHYELHSIDYWSKRRPNGPLVNVT